jgi:arylsulfatase A-like enzyme
MVKRHYGIRTERYKLIHFYYDKDEWELFDLETDPMGLKNVYYDPSHSSVKKVLYKRLSDLMKKYKDSDVLPKSFLPK